MSSILSSILVKKDSDWNRIIYNEDVVDRLIHRLKLPVVEDETTRVKGEYIVCDDGFAMVALKPALKNPLRLWIVLHEIGHHLLHYPVNHRFSRGTNRRMDREANFFATIALIPTFLIKENLLDDMTVDAALSVIAAEFNYPKELVKIRKEIYDTYKI